MADRPEISDSEWRVMNVVWEHQPVTASVVIQHVGPPNDWSPQTVRTFLHRLVKKGALTFEKDGNRYLYRALVSQASTITQASRSFLKSVFGGQTGPLLTHFVKSSKLSPEEIEALRDLLDHKESK